LRHLITGAETIYVEPFCGSASLFFSARPRSAYLSDLNDQLIASLKWMQDDPTELHRAFTSIPVSAADYYRIRNEYNQSQESSLDRSAMFVYLNRYCFNGLWRTNRKGHFNVPFGGVASEAPPLEFFLRCSMSLSSARLENCDFRLTLESEFTPNHFIFIDPPYFTESARTFLEYGPKTFGWLDLLALHGRLQLIREQGARIAMVYCDVPEVRDLFRGWTIETVSVTRNVGGFAARRKVEREVLITSFSVG
jgi:DNA adenine methylase